MPNLQYEYTGRSPADTADALRQADQMIARLEQERQQAVAEVARLTALLEARGKEAVPKVKAVPVGNTGSRRKTSVLILAAVLAVVYIGTLYYTVRSAPSHSTDSPASAGVVTVSAGGSEASRTQRMLEDHDPGQTQGVPELTPELPPPNGTILYENGAERVAPLSIETTGTSRYLVKLKDASGSDIFSFFVWGGHSVEVDVPLGTYTLVYASGETWYGESGLFGEETYCARVKDLFDFYREGDYVNGWTVELYPQTGGNLRTEEIAISEF